MRPDRGKPRLNPESALQTGRCLLRGVLFGLAAGFCYLLPGFPCISNRRPAEGHAVNQRRLIRLLQVATGVLLGLAAIFFWLARGHGRPGPEAAESYFLPEAIPAPSFALTAQDGRRVSSDDFPNRILVVFFGYTYCPDVCPLTLTHLTRAFRLLEEEGDRIQVLLVSVDPERDTPERLEGYLDNFHPSFLGLTGTEEEIREVADAFGAYFARVGEGDDYTVDHTARSFVVSPARKIILTFPVTATPQEMARDLQALLIREKG